MNDRNEEIEEVEMGIKNKKAKSKCKGKNGHTCGCTKKHKVDLL